MIAVVRIFFLSFFLTLEAMRWGEREWERESEQVLASTTPQVLGRLRLSLGFSQQPRTRLQSRLCMCMTGTLSAGPSLLSPSAYDWRRLKSGGSEWRNPGRSIRDSRVPITVFTTKPNAQPSWHFLCCEFQIWYKCPIKLWKKMSLSSPFCSCGNRKLPEDHSTEMRHKCMSGCRT